ncbi:Nramp family divalent metal transporter [Symmachiella dynata]|uniref:Nramp family divalent metal transporter n=1 Tax=Symmachiella dynata TaxID=2527995 RepID=UPI0030EB7CBC
MTEPNFDEHDTLPPSMDPAVRGGTEDPPRDFLGIIKRLGPGMIIAGSIVGSGELIATTKTGAEAGITLLWLIIIGCVIKVFVQIEIGRYTVSHGETPLAALNRVPGPRLRVNWLLWYWLVMMISILGQAGGIVGGVGQSLAIAVPITGDYARAVQVPNEADLLRYVDFIDHDQVTSPDELPEEAARIQRGNEFIAGRMERLGERGAKLIATTRELIHAQSQLAEIADTTPAPTDGESASPAQIELAQREQTVSEIKSQLKEMTSPFTFDDRIWGTIIALITVGLLCRGRYKLIQNLSMTLVVSFTFITIGNVISLQTHEEFALKLDDYLYGLSFHIPEGIAGLKAAMFTFGIIGVGASELVAYPYWCLEKGYAKYAGPRSPEESWAKRARGWMMVMHYDAFASMVVYTIATLAFFVMGAAALYQQGLVPEGMRMVSTLIEQYVPVFGEHARWLFLIGAIAVLYSTFLVANAGFARLYTDFLKVLGVMDPHNEKTHDRSIMIFGMVLPMICAGVYWIPNANPVALVMFGGLTQAVMLPMLAFAALFFRYRMTDRRLCPGRLWDVLLIISCIGLTIAGVFTAFLKLAG